MAGVNPIGGIDLIAGEAVEGLIFEQIKALGMLVIGGLLALQGAWYSWQNWGEIDATQIKQYSQEIKTIQSVVNTMLSKVQEHSKSSVKAKEFFKDDIYNLTVLLVRLRTMKLVIENPDSRGSLKPSDLKKELKEINDDTVKIVLRVQTYSETNDE